MKVYNPPLNVNFLNILSEFVFSDMSVNDIILLPTNRAVKTLKKLLFDLNGGQNLLLPTILSLDSAVADFEMFFKFKNKNNLSEISKTKKIFLLNSLVASANPDLNFSSSFAMSVELAHILDTATNEMVNWNKLEDLNLENLSEFSKKNVEFLNIISKYYPAILKEENLVDNKENQINLFLQFAKFLSEKKDGRIIIAGTTASMVQTQKMIKELAGKDNFYLFLPSFDEKYLGYKGNLAPTHPMYSMLKLVQDLGVEKFENLANYETYKMSDDEKILLMHQLNIAASKSYLWNDVKFSQKAIENVVCIEAEDIEQEALSVAYEIYESYVLGETVCAIVPSTNLTKSLVKVLENINVPYDISSSVSFDKSALGQIFNLTLDFLQYDIPVSFLNCIKNKFFVFQETEDVELMLRKNQISALTESYQKSFGEFVE
ncbi:MAG: hypothetical protein LBR35_00995, partial [Rickettsiales bacterium]|nr:hypothetical protein [Rickettsiales bacterium]